MKQISFVGSYLCRPSIAERKKQIWERGGQQRRERERDLGGEAEEGVRKRISGRERSGTTAKRTVDVASSGKEVVRGSGGSCSELWELPVGVPVVNTLFKNRI